MIFNTIIKNEKELKEMRRFVNSLNFFKDVSDNELSGIHKCREYGLKLSTINYMLLGEREGLNVDCFFERDFSEDEDKLLYEALSYGLDVHYLINNSYDRLQMIEIIKGLKDKVDVSIYADMKYSAYGMSLIRDGLYFDIDFTQLLHFGISKANVVILHEELTDKIKSL
ncbi:MAG: hypothetical protein R3Y64_10380 [Peptostreptococcaceae bacterium]